MTASEAKKLIAAIIESLEKKGIDHYTVSEERRGQTGYVELRVSIKTK